MGAPKGNQFWQQRTKHGRDKLFSSPEILWEEAMKYFQWCVDNPLFEKDWKGKDAFEVDVPKMRAFTWSGLELFLGIESLRSYRNDDSYKDFKQIITRIDQIIYTQKLEGSAAGLLNASIIARDLGLRDDKNINLTDSRKSTSELFPDDLEDANG